MPTKSNAPRTPENLSRDKQYAAMDFRLFCASRLARRPRRECGYDRKRVGTSHCPYCGKDPR